MKKATKNEELDIAIVSEQSEPKATNNKKAPKQNNVKEAARIDASGKELKVERKEIAIVRYTFKQRYVRIMLLAVGMTFFIQYFILPTGIFLSGVEGTLNGITYAISIGASSPEIMVDSGVIVDNYNVEMNLRHSEMIYWILFSLYNTAILIWSSKKIDKKYTILSSAYFITAAVAGFGFSIINEATGFSIITSWDSMIENSSQIVGEIGPFYGRIIYYLVIVVSVVFAVVPIGYITTSIYKLGGCADGFDPIGYYISLKSGKDFGKMILYYTMISVVGFMILDYFILYNVALLNATNLPEGFDWAKHIYPAPGWGLSEFLLLVISPQLLGSLTYVFILTAIIDSRFPRNKKLSLFVSTDKMDQIRFEFLRSSFDRGFTIIDSRGGFNLKRRGLVNIVINYRELESVVEFINDVDENAFIVVNNVEEVYTKHWSDKIQEFIHIPEDNKKIKFEEFNTFASDKFNSVEERLVQDAVISAKLAKLGKNLNKELKKEIINRVALIEDLSAGAKSSQMRKLIKEQDLKLAEDKRAILAEATIVDETKIAKLEDEIIASGGVIEHVIDPKHPTQTIDIEHSQVDEIDKEKTNEK